MGNDQDDTIFAPYTTVQKRLQGQQNIQNITISAASAESTSPVADAVAVVMRTQHKLVPGEPDDFTIRTQEEIADIRTATVDTMTNLLAGIAGVSLIVGGIGIMNIMLVSVTERTREIGIRMAIGAKGRDVLLQFLVEAIVISLLGGGIGIALGFGDGRSRHARLAVSDGRAAGRDCDGVRLLGRDRHLLRLLPCPEGCGAGSDCRAPLRVARSFSRSLDPSCRARFPPGAARRNHARGSAGAEPIVHLR